MTGAVTISWWVAVVAALFAAWGMADLVLLPLLRWVVRRRVDRALEEAGGRLQIPLQPFKLTRRRTLIDRLVFDRRVMETAEAWVEEGGLPRRAVQDRIEAYAREIVPAFNAYVYFRLGYWIARAIARALYRVRLGAVDEAALAAIPRGATVVFVMNHRSNMDYVLVAYLAMERTALSYAVGEWARIWPLESLVRSMGAYFVRRRSRNALYRAVLARYVDMATREGVTQAVYPEGGLSRDGRLQAPRLGLLDYMLRDFDPSEHRDVVFVPVGLNYDRVLEDRTLLLGGGSEAPRPGTGQAIGTLVRFLGRNLLLRLQGRWFRFGYACVNFGTPVSAADWLGRKGADPRHMERGARFELVGELARDLMTAVGDVVPVLPVSLVSSVLVAEPQRSWSELELKAAVQARIVDFEEAGRAVYIPRRDRDYALEVGLRMLLLRRLVAESDGLFRAVEQELPVLRYYANSIAHLPMPTEADDASSNVPIHSQK